MRDAQVRDVCSRPRGGGRLQPEADLMHPLLQDLHAVEPLRVPQEVPPKVETASVSLSILWKGKTILHLKKNFNMFLNKGSSGIRQWTMKNYMHSQC